MKLLGAVLALAIGCAPPAHHRGLEPVAIQIPTDDACAKLQREYAWICGLEPVALDHLIDSLVTGMPIQLMDRGSKMITLEVILRGYDHPDPGPMLPRGGT